MGDRGDGLAPRNPLREKQYHWCETRALTSSLWNPRRTPRRNHPSHPSIPEDFGLSLARPARRSFCFSRSKRRASLSSLESRSSGVTAFVVPLVRVSKRVAALAPVGTSPRCATDRSTTSSTTASQPARLPSSSRTSRSWAPSSAITSSSRLTRMPRSTRASPRAGSRSSLRAVTPTTPPSSPRTTLATSARHTTRCASSAQDSSR